MVSTRSMAGKVTPDDADTEQFSLRKKPVRRATAKSTQSSQKSQSSRSSSKAEERPTSRTTRTTRQAVESVTSNGEHAQPSKSTTRKPAEAAHKAQPLSPKKITQVARAPPLSTHHAEPKKSNAVANARPKRPVRNASSSAPEKEAAVNTTVTKPIATRGRPRKVPVEEVEVFDQGRPAGVQGKKSQEEENIQEEPALEESAQGEPAQETTPHDLEKEDEHDELDTEVGAASAGTSPVRTRHTSAAAPSTSRRTRARTPKPNNNVSGQECDEDHFAQAQPPLTVSKPTNVKETTPAHQDIAADDSDDEICGPKTPMRRGWTPAKPSGNALLSKTPARRLLLGAHKVTPQTQKVPIRAPAPASPQRPMTVARGASKPMVFRPLPRPEERREALEPSPSKLERNRERAADSFPVVEEEQDAAMADNVAEDHDSAAMAQEEKDIQEVTLDEYESEDELHGDGQSSDDEEQELLDAPNDDLKEPTYEDESLLISDDEAADDDESLGEDDETLIQPRLPAEILTSSPAPSVPDMANHVDVDVTMSDLQSSPAPSSPGSVQLDDMESSPAPSTPGSVIVHRIADTDTPTQDQTAPVSRLSRGDTRVFPDDMSRDIATPKPDSRMSLNTATARMLQTPGMRTFRESLLDFSPTSESDQGGDDVSFDPNCIDPALLSTQEEAFDLAQEADALAISSPGRLDISLAEQAETLQPPKYFPGRLSMDIQDDDSPRLSLLRESVMIAPAEYVPSPQKPLDMAWSTQLAPAAHMVPEQIPTFQGVEHMDQFMEMDIDLLNTSKELEAVDVDIQSVETRDFAHLTSSAQEAFPHFDEDAAAPMTPALPRYARPTVTSEARRMSMPTTGSKTPMSVCKRPITAETTIKPITSEAFATLWATKQEKSKRARRSSTRNSGFAPIAQSATPKLVKIKTPVTARSETRSMRLRKVRVSEVVPQQEPLIEINEQPATPEGIYTGPRPRKHTPSSSIVPLSTARRSKTPQPPPMTPMKTPLKPPGATPAAFPMTPHPSQPLSSVTALVEIFTLDGSSASGPFIALLQRLGARTTKVWSDRVTHVVFKDGSPATLQKVRLANKEHVTSSDGSGQEIYCVNSRWVTDCDKDGSRKDERSEEYAVDVDDVGAVSKAAGRHRRRKSMEPASLRNVDGNVVATDGAGSVKPRRASIGRKSMGRVSLASTCWGTPGMSPIKGGSGITETPFPKNFEDQENEEDDSFWGSEVGTPTLPGYMNRQQELEMLQRTAPVNRMRKLRLKDSNESGRRLTFLGGSE